MQAIVDQDTCISCGSCVSMCPEVYQFNNDNKAYAVVDSIPSDQSQAAKEARDSCPVNAIDIKE